MQRDALKLVDSRDSPKGFNINETPIASKKRISTEMSEFVNNNIMGGLLSSPSVK
jgi:hypothetical protein